jgi:glycine cleavage system regulatory protein
LPEITYPKTDDADSGNQSVDTKDKSKMFGDGSLTTDAQAQALVGNPDDYGTLSTINTPTTGNPINTLPDPADETNPPPSGFEELEAITGTDAANHHPSTPAPISRAQSHTYRQAVSTTTNPTPRTTPFASSSHESHPTPQARNTANPVDPTANRNQLRKHHVEMQPQNTTIQTLARQDPRTPAAPGTEKTNKRPASSSTGVSRESNVRARLGQFLPRPGPTHDELLAQVARLKATVADNKEQHKQYLDTIERLTDKLEELTEEVEGRENSTLHLQELTAQVQQRDWYIDNLTVLFEQRDARIEELETRIQERDHQIQELQAEVDKRDLLNHNIQQSFDELYKLT